MRGLRRFVNVPRELGYNAGMRSKRDYTWLGLLIIAAFVAYLFMSRPDPKAMTSEQQAEAAFEMRSGQMQN